MVRLKNSSGGGGGGGGGGSVRGEDNVVTDGYKNSFLWQKSATQHYFEC